MIVENFVSFFFGVIMTFFSQRLFGGNKAFFNIIEEFRKKLPPNYKRAESGFNEMIGIQQMNLSKLDSNINRNDLDYLLKQLEDFDYDSIYLKRKQIKRYSQNIQRLIKTTENDKFCIGILQELFEGRSFASGKPYILGEKISKYIKF